MPDFADESEVYEYLKHRLAEAGHRVLGVRVGLGRFSPDIDLLLEIGGERVGLEIKYLYRKPIRAYEGIGEALALLLHGLDKVYLVHVFDTTLLDSAREIIENCARLVELTPLGYMVMIGRTTPETIVEAKQPYRNGKRSFALKSP